MRIGATIAWLAAVLLIVAGCPKKEEAAGVAGTAPQQRPSTASAAAPAAPDAAQPPTAATAQQTPAAPAETEQDRAKRLGMGQNKVMTPETMKLLQTSPAAPEQLELVKKGMLAELPARGLKYDAASDKVTGPAPWDKGMTLMPGVRMVAAKLKATGTLDEASIKQTSNDFLDDYSRTMSKLTSGQLTKQNNPPPTPATTHQGPGGETVEPLKNQSPPKFTPAHAVLGEWRSLREVNEAYTTQVNHNDSYHETMSIRGDGTCTWVIYRQGNELSRDELKWKFNNKTGELALSYPTGQAYMTLTALSADNDPGDLYIRTPKVDRIKVFGKQ